MAKWLRSNVPNGSTLTLLEVGHKLADDREWNLLHGFLVRVIGTRSLSWRKLIQLASLAIERLRDQGESVYEVEIDIGLICCQHAAEGRFVDQALCREISILIRSLSRYGAERDGLASCSLRAVNHALEAVEYADRQRETGEWLVVEVAWTLVWAARASSDSSGTFRQSFSQLFSL